MKAYKKLIYSSLEKLTFGKGLPKTINRVPVILPAKFIRYFPSDYEADNFKFLQSHCNENAVILDIGAHIGLFSTVAAKITKANGKIYAFEPTPQTVKILKQTIRLNKLANVIQPINEAMGSKVGKITFFISDDEGDNGNSLVFYKEDRKLNGIEVAVNTIDNFATTEKPEKIDFIKIDVEGAEYDTLQGGINVFKTHRPYIILAIHPEPIIKKGDKLEDIYHFLQQLNYTISYQNKRIPKEEFCNNDKLIDLHLSPL